MSNHLRSLLVHAARHGELTPTRLRRLLDWGARDLDVLVALAARADLDEATVAELAHVRHPKVRAAWLTRVNCTDDEFRSMLDVETRVSVLTDVATALIAATRSDNPTIQRRAETHLDTLIAIAPLMTLCTIIVSHHAPDAQRVAAARAATHPKGKIRFDVYDLVVDTCERRHANAAAIRGALIDAATHPQLLAATVRGAELGELDARFEEYWDLFVIEPLTDPATNTSRAHQALDRANQLLVHHPEPLTGARDAIDAYMGLIDATGNRSVAVLGRDLVKATAAYARLAAGGRSDDPDVLADTARELIDTHVAGNLAPEAQLIRRLLGRQIAANAATPRATLVALLTSRVLGSDTSFGDVDVTGIHPAAAADLAVRRSRYDALAGSTDPLDALRRYIAAGPSHSTTVTAVSVVLAAHPELRDDIVEALPVGALTHRELPAELRDDAVDAFLELADNARAAELIDVYAADFDGTAGELLAVATATR